MKQYIDKESALSVFRPWLNVKDYNWGERNIIGAVIQALEDMDPADVVGVARPVGYWEYYRGWRRCSECNDCYVEHEWISNGKWKFCHTCGARLEYVDNSKA